MDLLAHARLAVRLPLITRLAHVLALGSEASSDFLKDRPAFSSTRDNEAGCVKGRSLHHLPDARQRIGIHPPCHEGAIAETICRPRLDQSKRSLQATKARS